MLTDEQASQIASEITIADVYEYVKNHPKEYKEFIDKEQNKRNNNVEDPYDKVVENIVINGILEVPV